MSHLRLWRDVQADTASSGTRTAGSTVGARPIAVEPALSAREVAGQGGRLAVTAADLGGQFAVVRAGPPAGRTSSGSSS